MKQELEMLFRHETLSREQAKDILQRVLREDISPPLTASFLTVFNMRAPSVEELAGFRDALMETCLSPGLDAADAIDIVGTGGDGKNTFNISTLSALVVAGAGVRVVKHGNYASGSVSGSSNVLERIGYAFTSDGLQLARQLGEANICFLHAPLFHPSMSLVREIRKDLGVQTFFNLLGPLCNPARPGRQLLGVSHHQHIRRYQYLLEEMGTDYCIVHSLDGYDEVSLTGDFKIVRRDHAALLSPPDIGMPAILPRELEAGRSPGDARLFLDILKGNGTRQQELVVIANSAFAIQCASPGKDIHNCIELAERSLCSGKAYDTLKKLTNSL